jgi:very-short-patch-repair endonuclease
VTTTDDDLASRIAQALKRLTHTEMSTVAKEVGLLIPPEATGLSKRDRALLALTGKTRFELGQVGRQLGALRKDFSLEELGCRVVEEGEPPITEITRRDVAKCFCGDLSGERNVLELLHPFLQDEELVFVGNPLVREIEQHVIRNSDWSVQDIFERVGALTCSRYRFATLIEAALHPLSRRGPEQAELAEAVNLALRRDGYQLVSSSEESGYPVFSIVPLVRGVIGKPKNLVFASNGPKPEIGFRDAINNDIVVLSNADSCLIYDRPIGPEGLLWSDLVAWWQELTPATPSADALGARLHASLDSEAEKNLFASYFRLYRRSLGPALPALLPQVYLHYDPAVVKELRRRSGLARQRMDFLLLLANKQRVVIEVDGSQHFSSDGKPSLPAYAAMVSADRDLRLDGYEVYRFGANELVGSAAQSLIERFFDRLWRQHKVRA